MDKGSITNGDTHIIPMGDSPLALSDSLNIVSGWPLRRVYPNMEYHSRYHISVAMLMEDLASNATGYLTIPSGIKLPSHDYTKDYKSSMFSDWAQLSISNLKVRWNNRVPQAEVSIGDDRSICEPGFYVNESDVGIPLPKLTGGYLVQNYGRALTDPTSAGLTNHYSVIYAGLDRGYGYALHGYFLATTSGTWTWAIDGYDAIEVVIDGGVVVKRFANVDVVSNDQSKWGTIELSAGWHHFFAYTSDKDHSANLQVWFKRPGEVSYTKVVDTGADNMIWAKYAEIPPNRVKFQYNGTEGTFTAGVEYDSDRVVSLSFSDSLLLDGNIQIKQETIPRFLPYYLYTNYWRESNITKVDQPITMPPRFQNIRGIMEFDPRVELLFYHDSVIFDDFTPKFLVAPKGSLTWYSWTGSAFQSRAVSSVSDLTTYGNTLRELNDISDTDWDELSTDRIFQLMFTDMPPLALTYNRKLFSGTTAAQYILGTKAHIPAQMRGEIRNI